MKLGSIYKTKEGHKLELVQELSKDVWAEEFITNKSISKVYGVEINSYDKGQCAFHKAKKAFNRYIDELKDRSFIDVQLEEFSITEGHFDEMKQYAYENEYGQVGRRIHFTDSVCKMTWRWEAETYFIHGQRLIPSTIETCIVPWHDGVMLQSMIVNKESRNKGVGWAFFDEFIHSVSYDLNIPLYLTPYPAEDFNPKSEKSLVKRLTKYYSNWDFQPVNNVNWNKIYKI
jgi:hypothetical protein